MIRTLKESEIYYIENETKPDCFILLNLDNIYEIEKNNIQILTPLYNYYFTFVIVCTVIFLYHLVV